MSRPFGPFNHVARLALLFALALAAFVVLRSWFVPSDFGVYGHYRAGALDDNRARVAVYAGQGACVECHADVVELRQGGRHAGVRCEACHGPLAAHASGDSDVVPRRPDPRALCISCHAQTGGKPAAFPQVIVREHAAEAACTACHPAHKPAVG